MLPAGSISRSTLQSARTDDRGLMLIRRKLLRSGALPTIMCDEQPDSSARVSHRWPQRPKPAQRTEDDAATREEERRRNIGRLLWPTDRASAALHVDRRVDENRRRPERRREDIAVLSTDGADLRDDRGGRQQAAGFRCDKADGRRTGPLAAIESVVCQPASLSVRSRT